MPEEDTTLLFVLSKPIPIYCPLKATVCHETSVHCLFSVSLSGSIHKQRSGCMHYSKAEHHWKVSVLIFQLVLSEINVCCAKSLYFSNLLMKRPLHGEIYNFPHIATYYDTMTRRSWNYCVWSIIMIAEHSKRALTLLYPSLQCLADSRSLYSANCFYYKDCSLC